MRMIDMRMADRSAAAARAIRVSPVQACLFGNSRAEVVYDCC
jgi:hypothetical protein